MALYFYRGCNFIKNYVVKYLNAIFLANSKDNLAFFDGTKKIEFSAMPHAIKRYSWTDRRLPVVLVGATNGNFIYRSVNKDLINAPVEGSTDTTTVYDYYGGDINMTVDLAILATQITERDHLVDIVGIYLSHPSAKDYFQQHGIVIPEGPRFGSESEVNQPGIDYPIYRTTMSLSVMGVWQDRQEAEKGVTDVISSITAYIE